ncbi:MAG TPA: hypothetical protein VF260_03225 [Bacilli bacterium]
MKNSVKILVATVLFGSGLWLGSIITSNADGLIPDNQPGSVNDPVVTKSYVDETVQELVKSELAKRTQTGGDSSEMTVIMLQPGQTLYAGAGAEFIVRPGGKAVAFSTDGNGIPDLTSGEDLPNGKLIEFNHLLIFPRDGGRGIKPAPSEKHNVYVMVRGKYSWVDKDGTEIKQ